VNALIVVPSHTMGSDTVNLLKVHNPLFPF
jgi:hypothetical protein